MGEFTDGFSSSQANMARNDKDQTVGGQEGGYETDAPGVFSHDKVKVGIDEFPVFDISTRDFENVSQYGRQRTRFSDPESKTAADYMKTTRYQRPFYVRADDPAGTGKKFIRRIK